MWLYGGVLSLGVGVLIVQIVGGLLSGSLALLADSGHVAVDNLVLVGVLVIAYLVKKYRHQEKMIRMWGGYANAFLMFGIGVWVLVEAIDRWQYPLPIQSPTLIVFATLGGFGNWLQYSLLATAASARHTVTSKSARLHVLSDLWQSVAVVIGGVVVYVTDWSKVDTVLSFIISAVMFYWAGQIFWWSKKGVLSVGHHGHHHH